MIKERQGKMRADQDPRWRAIVERDPAFDGKFYYSVKSTGVYCHPSCAARLARPENVAFHDSIQDAERAGFRPCKRCKPDQGLLRERQAAVVEAACRNIEAADEPPSLETLAEAVGMSPYYFHRVFKTITGVTPKAYADAHRTQRVQRELAAGSRSVTETIYEAGFNSSSRFYETTKEMLGMKPKEYKQGGLNAQIHFAVGQSSLGSILVARSEKGVCAILLGDDPEALVRDLQDRFPKAQLLGGDRGFEEVVAKVVGFVEDPSRGLDLPLDVRGTAFQQRVWEALRGIPVGKTASYAEIARKLGEPGAVRAVAGACAANALAVAIPCHRVVKSDGALSGYRWGVDRKRELLRREAVS
ncbi:bifunctional DNA-binding transcriptional regulator/O6-methylguanine-DNA methyltransferase Ada [Fimbriimonas ginsengisoli]|uniref:methylated-DNA--[protein]-cysteine S-methyltransferase n=1 Tax=Fimbriimonas ginsengisoli Gsoil 348 TaxID=661478 RepID=A0A068NT23_FIMGI|nr:bifunctional DNA-binding transcriptional regulator/O6-methylguanine-DNA methyltransferase Ada [Fimbriimonas ginsengisoli]AIE85925.1 transcriptional regulator, AraC family [Fimbriimonas ginsengisoli Gsoil 348]